MRISHCGDIHLEEDRYFEDTALCLEWFVEDSIRANTNLFVVDGDLTTYKQTINERNLWVERLIQMGNHSPVILVAGNHGKELDGDLHVLARAKATHPIYLCTKPDFIELGEADVAVFPYGTAYGPVPVVTAASLPDRAMTDMDDAMALDTLKTLKKTDEAGTLVLQAGDQLESGSGVAAPGSSPFLTAAAVVASIQCQALTQKMLAAELRQEAARLAHESALLKRSTTYTGQVGEQIINLLKRK